MKDPLKRYLMELAGTFFLVLMIGLTKNPVAIGAMLTAIIYMGGHISGAHYNPAVTFAMIIRGRIDVKSAMVYIFVQLIGATLAALAVHYMYGKGFAPVPDTTINVLKPVFIETIFTFALVSVILNVATHSRTADNSYYGLAIGFTVIGAAYAGGPISGGAFNPSVAFGPMLVNSIFHLGDFRFLWIYLVGPFLGAAIAAVWFRISNPEE